MSTDNVVRHVLNDGTIKYRNAAGELHREDGPAVVYSDGTEEWCLKGKFHRIDGPSVVRPGGTKKWYLNGVLHRADGPALVDSDGTEFWCRDGKCHREDGPAVVQSDGSEWWYLDGKLHRIDGPAVVDLSGNYEYWIDGVFIIGKTIEDVYCLEQEGYEVYKDRLSTELVVKVMSDKGFASVEDFVSWLAFEVLGDEAAPVLARAREEGTMVLSVLDEYLQNHTDYAGLPFSWWYPIVGGRLPLS